MNELLTVQTSPAVHIVPPTDISGANHDDHLIAMWLSGRPKHTKRSYQSDIARFRAAVSVSLRSVTAAAIVDYAESLGRARLALSTQHRKLSAIKSLFTYAQRLGYVPLNPSAALRMPKPMDNRASKILDVDAVHKVIAGASEGRDRLICKTLYLCGLRESELISLRLCDVQSTPTGAALAIEGKASKIRYVAIPPELADELRSLGNSPIPERPIFRSVAGNKLSASDIYRMVVKAGLKAGHRVTPHFLRHAHVSHALDLGAPIHLVRETVGHSSLATTSIYSHSKPSESSALFLTSTSRGDRPSE